LSGTLKLSHTFLAEKPLGVSYQLKVYIGEEEDPEYRMNMVDCQLIKLQNAPMSVEPRFPVSMVTKEFTFTPGQIDLKVTLDRELFHHWEKVPVTVYINNESTKTVRSIKCNILQHVEVSVAVIRGRTFSRILLLLS
jgi:Arrestin (or S-antigen), C-terminal domain